MASEIRELLATAQQAEVRGDLAEAVRVLRLAEAFYLERSLAPRAEQMSRHIARLQERLTPTATLGFGDELLGDDAPKTKPVELQDFERTPALADPAVDAWCSFCCRPKTEVGSMVAGPAGAFICGACLSVGTALLGGAPAPSPKPVSRAAPTSAHDLPAQARARHRWATRAPRVALVIGPAGSGKTAFARSLGEPVRTPLARAQPIGDLLVIDLHEPLTADDERELERWLSTHPLRRVVLSVRGAVPAPMLVLQGEHGEEPVFDTAGLSKSLEFPLSEMVLRQVDAVLPLEAPDAAALSALALAQLASRGVSLASAAVEQLVNHAVSSGRGAHELATLISRIPPGKYT